MAVLESCFRPEFSFIASQHGTVIGIAGIQTSQGGFTSCMTPRMLSQSLRPWRTARALSILMMLERKLTNTRELYVEGIAVSSSSRGKGIGTLLLNRVMTHARSTGRQWVRLDVVDTNPAARRRYERLGFESLKVTNVAYLKWLLGFCAVEQMQLQVDGRL